MFYPACGYLSFSGFPNKMTYMYFVSNGMLNFTQAIDVIKLYSNTCTNF